MNIQLINPKERPISDGVLYRLLGLGLIPAAALFHFIADDFPCYRYSSLKRSNSKL